MQVLYLNLRGYKAPLSPLKYEIGCLPPVYIERREEVDGFDDICFALPVCTVDVVQSRCGRYFTILDIADVFQLKIVDTQSGIIIRGDIPSNNNKKPPRRAVDVSIR